MAYQQTAVIGFYRYQAGLALSKFHYLQGAGVINQALNSLGYQLFRGNNMINRNVLLLIQLFLVNDVLFGADPCYFGWGFKQTVSHLTGQHVTFVTVGHSNQHVGVFGTCFTQHIRVGTNTGYNLQIEAVLQGTQDNGIGIDHRDFVFFAYQVFSQCAAHLSCAKDDNFHRRCKVFLILVIKTLAASHNRNHPFVARRAKFAALAARWFPPVGLVVTAHCCALAGSG